MIQNVIESSQWHYKLIKLKTNRYILYVLYDGGLNYQKLKDYLINRIRSIRHNKVKNVVISRKHKSKRSYLFRS